MPKCSTIDSLVTPYVDGLLAGPDREAVEQHLRACPPCSTRVTAERAVRALLQERQPAFLSECASGRLRAECARHLSGAPQKVLAGIGTPTTRASLWHRFAPIAAAAMLIIIAGGAFLYRATQLSTRVLAAELAADHVKCFVMNAALGTHQTAQTVESSLASGFGWDVRVPVGSPSDELDLVGSRPCLYGEGKIAHVMYRRRGQPVSLFMLPGTARQEQVVEVFGQECIIWSRADRTFVLVTSGERSEAEQLAASLDAGLR